MTNGLGLQEDLEEGEMCTKLMEVQKQMMRLTTLVQDDLPLYETAETRHETWIEKATRRLSPSKTESSPKSNEAKDDETGASSASTATACYKQRDDPRLPRTCVCCLSLFSKVALLQWHFATSWFF